MPTRKIDVLHLFATLPVGGAEDLLKGIVTRLDPQLFAPRVACLAELGPVGLELRQAGVPVAALGLDLKHATMWRLVRPLRRFLQARRPDILHTHLYHPNLYGRLAALGLGLPGVIAAVHNSYTRVKLHRCLWNFLLARYTDYVLVGSRRVYDDVRRYDRVPPAKLRLLPYGIDMAEVATPLDQTQAKAALGLTGFCVGTIGRLEEQKGQKYLLAAVAQLLPPIPDLVLVIVGSGRLEQELRAQARELGIAGRVHFLGTRRDLPLLYRAMDVFVLPSLWEGLPLVLLKAMAAGLPVVATRVSGCQEVIHPGDNGFLVPPGDAANLAQAIHELQARPDLQATMGQRGRETIRRGYSLEAMLAQLAELYCRLVPEPRP